DLYGVDGTTSRLRGERSHNTRFTSSGGEEFVLRISSASEPAATIDCHAQALIHIERKAPELPVPRMLVAHNGQLVPTVELDGRTHRVRLETYLPGITFLDGQAISNPALAAIGELLGGVAAALTDFDHPAACGFMPWDIANGLVIDDALNDALAEDAVELTVRARPRLDAALATMRHLPRQVIHNDGHTGNLLRTDASSDLITGLIDFGDMVHTVTVADIAVAGASIAPHQADPEAALAALAAGYHAHRPLTDGEVQAIPDLLLARLILSTLLVEYQIAHAPHIAQEVAADRPGTHAALARWLDIDPLAAADAIKEEL
ncbi:MAG TPA: phosphotransferase, partial [Ilumatobacteraceae bacterium]|nr:phosphotransferase [Ilumatobacteraceae bacterium]